MPPPDVRLSRIRRRTDKALELSRRRFLQLVGASAAVAWGTGCDPDRAEKILPYVHRPIDLTPGQSLYYATSLALDGFATPLLVETREGRPLRVEGNPKHPAGLSGANIFQQAAVWQLYDPDRASAVLQRGQPASWEGLLGFLSEARADRGMGLRVLLEPTSSPLVHAQLDQLNQRYPACKITFFQALPSQPPSAASQSAFGEVLAPRYDLSRAKVIAALDSDLLGCAFEPRYARDFAAQRHVRNPSAEMNRLYAIEAALSISGGMADHRLRRQSRRVAKLTAALADTLLRHRPLTAAELDAAELKFLSALARDLSGQPAGTTLVAVGPRQPAEVHVLGYAINAALGNLGQTVSFSAPIVSADSGDQSLAELTAELHGGKVDTLIMLGGNPVYDAPAELDFVAALGRAKRSLYSGGYVNETARHTTWFAPLSHPFECWADGRASDGTLSISQPLIRPLCDGKSVTELLGALVRDAAPSDHARLRARFGERFGEKLPASLSEPERQQRELPNARAGWEATLAQGFVADSALPPKSPRLREAAVDQALMTIGAHAAPSGIEINFLPSPTLHDGRFANVSWLLELPEPITKLTWDNALLMSPHTARRLGLEVAESNTRDDHPLVELRHAGRSLRVPLLCLPSHADDSVSLWLGYGREGAERLASGVGVNASRLRVGGEQFGGDVQISALPERYPLAITQSERDMQGRPIALSNTLMEYRSDPTFTAEYKGALPTLLPQYSLPGPQWAMSIDLGMCIGCSACVVACQAENNGLVVGKDQVRRGRAMHWLRIDGYYAHDDPTRVVHQPMLCQHCENAPCEYVCPVNATEHSPDGLNEMVYNRCIGTRFCSNNCPYKVRRFNWFDWSDHEPANQGRVELQRNPRVSVRERGVMEKCTYCVQRIRAAEITAREEEREIAAGEVKTACQQACPTNAITFGSLTDGAAPVVQWRSQERSYAVLHETGARPRTMYLARIDNFNPELT